MLSRVIGLVRVKYIALAFGRDTNADAFLAAFQLPDMIAYFLIGGALSITLVTMLTRYRDTGREAEGERTLSVILSTMLLVLGAAIVVAEVLAPWYTRTFFQFDAATAALCTHLTRILLPAQLCFFASGVYGAVLVVRKQFYAQAVAPLIYNLGTILGGVLLARRLGVSSMAYGTVAGALAGPLLVNLFGARRAGVRFGFVLDWQDEGLREWVRLSIPLMLGFSLITADTWIINHFASAGAGAVSVMTYAKQLFTAPMAVLAQAAGAASMPFFANLWAQKRHYEFANEVADAVSRVASLGLLAASGMMALAVPAVDLVMRGGKYSVADTRQTAAYFAIFTITLFLWSAQAIYQRAFFAAGNTMTPMIAGTVVTLVSLPVYALLNHLYGVGGLAMASDIGITLQTVVLAVLLHKERMVSLASVDYRELGRCLASGLAAGSAAWAVALGVGHLLHAQTRWADAVELVAGMAVWVGLAGILLERLGSALPRAMMQRLGLRRT